MGAAGARAGSAGPWGGWRRAALVGALVASACAAPTEPDDGGFSWDDSPRPTQPSEVVPVEAVLGAEWLDHALAVLRSAERQVEVSSFLLLPGLRVDRVLDALAAVADRGVPCRVLADEEGASTSEVIDWLNERGCEAKLDSPVRTTHTKLILADDEALFGSHNLTDAALGENVEASLRLRDPEAVGWLRRAFEALWAASEDPGPLGAARTGQVQVVANQEIVPALLGCLDAASATVQAMIYAIAWDPGYPGSEVDQLLSAVEAASARGVQVQVVVDGSPWSVDNGIDDAAIARLSAAGVAVRRSPAETVHHAKVLRCDDRVIVGDANWSYSGLVLYNGVSAVVWDEAVVRAYEGWFEGIWASASAP